MLLVLYIIAFLEVLGTVKAQTWIDTRQHHNQKLPRTYLRPLEDYYLKLRDKNSHDSWSGLAETNQQYISENPLKVHQPREDPKLFYLSKTYLKDVKGRRNEVSHVYPGREVIWADENQFPPVPGLKRLLRNGPELCVKCPIDRTLVAKPGSDRVKLLKQRLPTCAGRRAPRNIHFITTEGPRFGTLLHHGSHMISGRIMFKNETIQHCKFRVHVIIQTCPTPKYLLSHCGDQKHCNFTCRDPKMELQGKRSLICRRDRNWAGKLPVCRAQKWCSPLPPPEQGRINCKGSIAASGFVEGSRCRLRCPTGWQWTPRTTAICRHGTWTNVLKCRRINN